MTVRLEGWRVKRRDIEEWMRHRQFPLELQERVRRFFQYKWLDTRGIDEEFILQSLPLDLRREIQRQFYLALVRRVPLFAHGRAAVGRYRRVAGVVAEHQGCIHCARATP